MAALIVHRQQPVGLRICTAPYLLPLLLLALLSPSSADSTPSILVLLDTGKTHHGVVLDHIRKSIVQGYEGRMHPRIESLDSAEFDHSTVDSLQPDLIVTIGVAAAARLHGQAGSAAEMNIFLPRAAYQQLHEGSSGRPAAIFLDQPFERQLALARVLRPNAKRAGMLRAATTEQSSADLKGTALRFGFELYVAPITGGGDAAEAIDQVLASSDLIIATFDREAYKPATMKWLLYLAFQQQRPIIGFSQALLRAGAVASVYSTTEQIAEHAAELIRDWLNTGRVPSGYHYPRYYDIGLNAPVAKMLDVTPVDQVELLTRMRDALGDPR